ncbi:hypothetical protein Cgig2_004160 [Carnegiea gigantea]|uniref:Kinesin light chain n=1 Tax=Carnegiea gigantea TaxID=171969 RepID=A0A9Q1KSL9_9CARY|nr:hypothetical protein Cgig2_004160 [Carnegiea gigantea]
MPGIVVDGINEVGLETNVTPSKENSVYNARSSQSTLSPQRPQSEREKEAPMEGAVDMSIDQLYDNVCEMQSLDQSPSRHSYLSEGNESRIDSELRHLVGGRMRELQIMEEEVREEEIHGDPDKRENGSGDEDIGLVDKTRSAGITSASLGHFKKDANLLLGSEYDECPQQNGEISKKKTTPQKKPRNFPLAGSASALDNPDLGSFLLKQARDLLASGDHLHKALSLAVRAAKSFEICSNGKPSLELVMSLHVTAAIHCALGQHREAIQVLQRSIGIPSVEDGQDHALAKFSGYMQLGDTFAMLSEVKNSIFYYTKGLEIQRHVLGEKDVRVGETCRYLAEAHVQAMQFDEAEKLCQMALDIHKENGSPTSIEEAADRRLMGLICEIKGDHEKALEHLVLGSMAMAANGEEKEVAFVDCSIGDTYLSLSRYDEAISAYEKALTAFKSMKGENHPTIASVYIRLADLYNKIGKFSESKSYCENALHIYSKPIPGMPSEDIASGLTDVAGLYELMDELEQAIKLLRKALKIYNDAPGQQNTIAGIEAQMGVMYYMLGNYHESYNSLKSAVTKLRVGGEKKSAYFGTVLNQMGLACIQHYAINEAAELFEESRSILEEEYGPYHPETLGVYSNLAGTYDAMGRLDDAIEILEYVVGMREEKLGTANPDVDDEKRRLAELLKEAGKVRSRKVRSLEDLLDANS